MRKVRFTTVILTLMLSTLILLSAILIIPAYQSASRALSKELHLNYHKDQVVLEHLFHEAFVGIRQIADEVTTSTDILVGTMARSSDLLIPQLDTILNGKAGERIDAFVLEYDNGTMLPVYNLGLSDLTLPLEPLSKTYTPYGTWENHSIKVNNKHYSLLKLSLPIIERQMGEVIGKLHTFILLNDNFWVLNTIQNLTGASSVSVIVKLVVAFTYDTCLTS
ncbi:MAG: LuxQ periplasmic sensor domain-containing protein, partial [Pontibacterium sp.]